MIGRYLDLGNPVETAHPLNLGLVSWWLPLPNNSGGFTLFDLMRRNNGTLTNGAAWGYGPSPAFSAVTFDGSDDAVTYPAVTESTALTVAVVLNYDALPPGGGHDYATFAAKRNMSTNATHFVLRSGNAFAGAQDEIDFYWNTGGFSIWTTTAANLTAGRWYFLAVTKSGANDPVVYVDGAESSGGYTMGAASALTGNTESLYMGTLADGSEQFDGRMAGAAIYDRALAAGEIAALYREYLLGYPQTLRRWSRRRWLDVPAASAPAAGTSHLTLLGVG